MNATEKANLPFRGAAKKAHSYQYQCMKSSTSVTWLVLLWNLIGFCSTCTAESTLGEARVEVASISMQQQDHRGSGQVVAQVAQVYSYRVFAYDQSDNVIGTESIMRPGADVMAESSFTADPFSGGGIGLNSLGVYTSMDGWIASGPGAPEGETIPLRIHLMGHASASMSNNNLHSAQAGAGSFYHDGIISIERSAFAAVTAGHFRDTQEYDDIVSTRVPAGTFFTVVAGVSASALSYCAEDQSCRASAQAIADPTVEIDPSYTYKKFFSVEWITPSPVDAPNPLSVSIQGITNGTACFRLNCLSNHVCAIEATTDPLQTAWVHIAEITNYSETVSFVDTDAGRYSRRFYRAVALRKAK